MHTVFLSPLLVTTRTVTSIKKKKNSRESKAYKSSVAIYVAFGVRMLRVPVSTASGVFLHTT